MPIQGVGGRQEPDPHDVLHSNNLNEGLEKSWLSSLHLRLSAVGLSALLSLRIDTRLPGVTPAELSANAARV